MDHRQQGSGCGANRSELLRRNDSIRARSADGGCRQVADNAPHFRRTRICIHAAFCLLREKHRTLPRIQTGDRDLRELVRTGNTSQRRKDDRTNRPRHRPQRPQSIAARCSRSGVREKNNFTGLEVFFSSLTIRKVIGCSGLLITITSSGYACLLQSLVVVKIRWARTPTDYTVIPYIALSTLPKSVVPNHLPL